MGSRVVWSGMTMPCSSARVRMLGSSSSLKVFGRRLAFYGCTGGGGQMVGSGGARSKDADNALPAAMHACTASCRACMHAPCAAGRALRRAPA